MSKKQSNATRTTNAQNAAARAAAIRQRQDAKERRVRNLVVGAVVLVVLAAIVAIALAVQSSRDTTGQTTTPPSGVVDKYSLPLGASTAPVKVTVYEDFMCPYCGQFEAGSEQMLAQYVDQGDVQVRYHVISFLDRSSSSKYSTRAANALGVVLDTSGAKVAKKFHDLLYQNQPQEGSAGLSDAQLVDYAVQAGASKSDVSGPIKSLRFEQWVKNSTDAFSKKGLTGTPTVFVGGKQMAAPSIAELPGVTKAAIDKALKK